MRDRGLLVVLLASALTFLASLYLPWEVAPARSCSGSGMVCLLNLFSGSGGSFEGWSRFGEPAGLLALGLAAGAVAVIARPPMIRRLPLGVGAFALLFFAVMTLMEVRDYARVLGSYDHSTVHVAFGSYLGLASATIACLCGVGLRRREFERPVSPFAVVGAALTLGLLAAFLVPQLTFHVPHVSQNGASGYQSISLGDSLLIIFAVGLACFSLSLWTRTTKAIARIAVTAGIAVLAGGYLSLFDLHRYWPWELWLLLGCSLGLFALALVAGRGLRVGRPSVADAATFAAGCLLLVALFLPCQKGDFGNGWAQAFSATAGALAVLLLVLMLALGRFLPELAISTAIYVLVAGLDTTSDGGHLQYGAPIGFAGAALLLLVAVQRLELRTRLVRLVPLAACAVFVAIPVLALSDRFSPSLALESPWGLFLLGVAAVVVACRLFARWLNRPRDSAEVVLLPLVLLGLTALNLIYDRGEGPPWGGGIVVGLCLLLIGLGWVEEREGLGNAGFGGIFRVWEIPEGEI